MKRLHFFTSLATLFHVIHYFNVIPIPSTYPLAVFVFVLGQIFIHIDVLYQRTTLLKFMNSSFIHVLPLLIFKPPQTTKNGILFTVLLVVCWLSFIGIQRAFDMYIITGPAQYVL